jgi:hypothetical protein
MTAGIVTAAFLDGAGASRTGRFWSTDGTMGGTLSPMPVLVGADGVTPLGPSNPFPVSTGDNKHVNTTTLTRIANTTAYAGTAASPQAIGLFASVTAVTPLALTVSANNAVDGFITSMRLTKSTVGAVGASFVAFAYAAPPTLTSVFDGTVYTPKLADIVASPTKFIGAWFFSNQTINGDNSTYDGLSSSNNSLQAFNLTDGTLRFVLATTGAYVPGSGETFTLTVDMTTNVQ